MFFLLVLTYGLKWCYRGIFRWIHPHIANHICTCILQAESELAPTVFGDTQVDIASTRRGKKEGTNSVGGCCEVI